MQGLSVSIVPAWEYLEYSVPTRKLLFGLILVREMDEHLGFGELIKQHLTDSRDKNTKIALTDLTRQGKRHRFSGSGKAQDGNSVYNLSLSGN